MRISFHRFLGFPGVIPDATRVWLFRERLAESGRDRLSGMSCSANSTERGSARASPNDLFLFVFKQLQNGVTARGYSLTDPLIA